MKTEKDVLRQYEWTDNNGKKYYNEDDILAAMREYAALLQPPAPARSADDIILDWLTRNAYNDPHDVKGQHLGRMLTECMEEYRLQGLLQFRSCDMEDVLFRQGVNESFTDFINRYASHYPNPQLIKNRL